MERALFISICFFVAFFYVRDRMESDLYKYSPFQHPERSNVEQFEREFV